MKKIFLTVIVGLLLIQVLPANASIPLKGGKLIVCQPAEPPGLDPTANTAAAIDRVVFSNIYEGLVKIDRDGKYIPGLATGWHVSTDGKNLYLYTSPRGSVS